MQTRPDDQVSDALLALPGWAGDARAISREFRAPDFPSAIRLVDDVAIVAERRNHHPDIDIRWVRVRFALSSHEAGGVTSADLALAEDIDQVAAQFGISA